LDPSSERRQTREAHVQAAQAERRALSGQPQEGSFECVARRWFAGGQVRARDTLETAHRLPEHCSSVFRYAIAEGADLRDSCHDIRNALKRPSVRHFAGITKPAELT
jgi:hypothetical protein